MGSDHCFISEIIINSNETPCKYVISNMMVPLFKASFETWKKLKLGISVNWHV